MSPTCKAPPGILDERIRIGSGAQTLHGGARLCLPCETLTFSKSWAGRERLFKNKNSDPLVVACCRSQGGCAHLGRAPARIDGLARALGAKPLAGKHPCAALRFSRCRRREGRRACHGLGVAAERRARLPPAEPVHTGGTSAAECKRQRSGRTYCHADLPLNYYTGYFTSTG